MQDAVISRPPFLYYEICAIASLIISLLTVNLTLYQIKLIFLNRTTLEDISKDYRLTMAVVYFGSSKNLTPYKSTQTKSIDNAKHTMGSNVFLWWIPTSPHLIEG